MARKRQDKRAAPFSLRLTFEERAQLERDAAGQSIANHVKAILFGPGAKPKRTHGKTPVKDHQALAELLARLGASRLANNLNQLAYAANTGTLPFDDATRQALNDAYAAVMEMRALLMHALGVAVKKRRPPKPSARKAFTRRAPEPGVRP